MFTGIIARTGKVASLTKSGGAAKLTIEADGFWNDDQLGDSIATDGVCLTITKINRNQAVFDVSDETLTRSIIGSYKNGSIVNLEKAVRPIDRMGGHIVQGHVDGLGSYKGKTVTGENVEMKFILPLGLSKYLVEKGSITINGVSLTAATVTGDNFSVAVISHTLEVTSLSQLCPSDKVNIEADVIAKYTEKLLLSHNTEDGLSSSLLADNGFI